ncbi:Choline dehydrogenase [Ascochyta rabiei]|uniref:Choline dehydrogenase n=1 Tax=Didymella rabiei TaxID=5454 RepID=A0A163KLZ0_DIDRA|nr:Choline dehydrogenase [Ascochyta rabiei]KZM27094.1 choline dehydrogenase [Ascochyta rabiei]UPX19825.1 Choline dehydrogenase [Ascochyta rabiei]
MVHPFSLLSTVQLVLTARNASAAYDYVIVGGGTAGMLLANRLSANPRITVAIVEAGSSAFNNPNVTYVPKSIAEFGLGFNTSVEWGYTTEHQKYAANDSLPYWAGKGIVGSTLINGMTYVRAEKRQIDAWEELGNEGWNWKSLDKYYVEQESFLTPSEQQRVNGATFEESAHGYEGGLDVGITPYITGQRAFDVLRETHEAQGYVWNKDVNTGNMPGFCTWPMTLDASKVVREDAARAFHYPVQERPNLHVFLNSTASHILWTDLDDASDRTASGVQIVRSDGTMRTLQAIEEVIVAAGSIRSPAILELSGIGNPSVLRSLGIETVVALPSVGSNLQDQPANGIVYSSPTNWTGYSTFASFLTASDLFGPDLSSVTASVKANLTSWASTILSDYVPNATTLAIQERLLQHQLDLVFTSNSTVPLAEILWAPIGNAIVAQFWNLLPFSRGSIHINSTNPISQPSINPNFFQLPIDTLVQAAIAVRVRKLFATPPLSQHVTAEVTPGFSAVPRNASFADKRWATWIKGSFSGNSHPVTTCAMMGSELGGVVDSEGKVYGTCNVRVVDASIFPTQISGHLSASVYALAGKIADAVLKKAEKV